MINTRVLELIKNPQIITADDLTILESETEKMPYAQCIRALYLYGIHLYKAEKYKENLSKTAAYTTDKKILYQFINSQTKQNIYNEKISQVENSKTTADEIISHKTESTIINNFDTEKILENKEKEAPEYLIVDGEKNRLLYKGEENFLEEKTSEIDIEATKESGNLVLKEETKNLDSLIKIDENKSESSLLSEKDSEIDETKISKEPEQEKLILKTEIHDESSTSDISFGGIQDFLPEVKFSVPKNHLDYLNPPKKEITEEKQDQIIPQNKTVFLEKTPEKGIDVEDENEISFENTQAFDIGNFDQPENQKIGFEEPQSFEFSKENNDPKPDEIENEVSKTESVSEWKPMNFQSNTPDALIGKPKAESETKEINNILKQEPETSTLKDTTVKENTENETSDEEIPVINVSFFGNALSKIDDQKESKNSDPDNIENESSNVSNFINTWQNWLKIDRKAKTEDENKPVAKEKIINDFIDKNPKISQLKEESSFVVKEKKEDISHLMTETLAKLYTEQKLYSKAIKAYEILGDKYPEKKSYFESKIEEVKEIRKP